jgi:hypothetical protein
MKSFSPSGRFNPDRGSGQPSRGRFGCRHLRSPIESLVSRCSCALRRDGAAVLGAGLLTTVPLLIIDDLGMRKLPVTAAEKLLEIIMRRYGRASTQLTSNRPVEDWGKLLGDSAAVSAMLDRLLHHGHVLKCGPRSWRTKTSSPG